MALLGISQPEIIEINNDLRLRTPDRCEWDKALPWYQNPEVLYYSEGISDGSVYGIDIIHRMYSCLNNMGELYFIEVRTPEGWKAIGDVTLSEENLPIVIGDGGYWGKGIGSRIISILLERAKAIGIKKIKVPSIYHYNKRSENLFKASGFIVVSENSTEKSYELNLDKSKKDMG